METFLEPIEKPNSLGMKLAYFEAGLFLYQKAIWKGLKPP